MINSWNLLSTSLSSKIKQSAFPAPKISEKILDWKEELVLWIKNNPSHILSKIGKNHIHSIFDPLAILLLQ